MLDMPAEIEVADVTTKVTLPDIALFILCGLIWGLAAHY